MRAIIYSRVSTDVTGRGRSVDEQRVECERECQRRGWDVIEVLTDNDIGASKYSKKPRPEWARVKRMLAAGGADVLVTWEASRAQRDLAAYVELRKLCVSTGTKWSYNGDLYDLADGEDAYRTGADALDAEREASRTSKRVRRAMAANADKGRPHGRTAYGYVRVYDDTTGELLGQRIDPERAAVVLEVVDRVLAGVPLITLAAEFNARGIPTATGGRWDATSVRRFAKNPAYAGLRVHQGKVVGVGDWPAIVDEDKHHRAVAMLSDPQRRTTRQRARQHLLTGIASCGVCGSALNTTIADRIGGQRSYICRNGSHVAVREQDLDAFVIGTLLDWMARPDGLGTINRDAPADVLTARAHIEKLRARLDAAADEYAAGSLSAAMLAKVDARLTAEIAEAERQTHHAPLPTTIADMQAANDPKRVWDSLTLEQQVEAVRSLFTIKVSRVTIKGRHAFDPNRVEILPRSS